MLEMHGDDEAVTIDVTGGDTLVADQMQISGYEIEGGLWYEFDEQADPADEVAAGHSIEVPVTGDPSEWVVQLLWISDHGDPELIAWEEAS